MAILKLRPSYKDYVWGGTRLITEFGKDFSGDRLAETWELSCHPDGPSYVENGEYTGSTLNEYILMEGKKVTGTKSRKYEQFPLLVKFIDAKDDLSIQVHPSDAFALENSNVTYRVYDYGRKGADGKERDLHIEKALQVTNRIPIMKRKSFEPHIVSCDYFTVDKVVLDDVRRDRPLLLCEPSGTRGNGGSPFGRGMCAGEKGRQHFYHGKYRRV